MKDELIEILTKIDECELAGDMAQRALDYNFADKFDMYHFAIENADYFRFLKESSEYLLVAPYRTASTYVYKQFNDSIFPCVKFHYKRPADNCRYRFMEKCRPLKYEELEYPHGSRYSGKLAIVEACYLYWLIKNHGEVRRVFVIVRDPIEMLISKKNYNNRYELDSNEDIERMNEMINYDTWYDNSIMKYLPNLEDKTTFVKFSELDEQLQYMPGIKPTRKINGLVGKDYDSLKETTFSREFLEGIYDSHILGIVYSEEEIQELIEKWAAKEDGIRSCDEFLGGKDD